MNRTRGRWFILGSPVLRQHQACRHDARNDQAALRFRGFRFFCKQLSVQLIWMKPSADFAFLPQQYINQIGIRQHGIIHQVSAARAAKSAFALNRHVSPLFRTRFGNGKCDIRSALKWEIYRKMKLNAPTKKYIPPKLLKKSSFGGLYIFK